MMGRADDLRFMGRALELARSGFAAPNPHVGCVIVRDGEIVGEGSSSPAGGDHAEVHALRAAGDRAKGATVYVTLEPCNHTGRTGPCSVALAEAGVGRVVVGVRDPNPKAVGGGEYLASRGVEVEYGVLEEEARAVHRQFLFAMEKGRPFVRVKAAITMDGKIAWPDGASKWITGEEARADGHRLRLESGSVLVGRRTVEVDDPLLTVRTPGASYQPLRVVIDPSGRLRGQERVFGREAETLWVVGEGFEGAGRTVLGDLSARGILEELFARGQTGVLVEGGAVTIRRFLEAGLVDQVVLYIAPKVFGAGIGWLGEGEAGWSPEGLGFEIVGTERFGPDLKVVFEKFPG